MHPTRGNGVTWKWLADELRQRIISGELVPEAALPSETQLVRQTGLSRTTVRRALVQLRSEGLVESRRPWGTFVLGGTSTVLGPGDELRSLAAVTITRFSGSVEQYPAGTKVVWVGETPVLI
jgi:DNA-binding GntR family transcriptional regulator